MGHSQSGSFPLAAALLNPAAMKGLVLVEPGTCPANYTAEQIATLAKVPILVVFGDYRDTPTGIPALPTWQARYEACQAMIGRIKEAGGQAQMLSPAEIGARGNSHMIMQDKNHLQVADLILKWIDERVSKPSGSRRNEDAAILAGALAAGPGRSRGPSLLQPAPTRLALELQDYAALPITADNTNANTRAQLARVNYLRDEPGGRRFFVNDLNGPLYILDKQTKAFTTYLDFNGLGGRPGLFPKFTFERNFATGLTSFIFDPDYARNGVFYTLHMEDPATDAPAAPKAGVVARPRPDRLHHDAGNLDADRRRTDRSRGRAHRMEGSQPSNTTFEGTARELMRLQHPLAPHPLGEMTFNPAARPGDPDWRVMYLGAGDAQSGEQRDSRRLNPQRLDTLVGKILRIVPDLREHTKTSTVSENGRYRIPNDNPFAAVDGARKEIWAYGLRNPHRLAWDVDRRSASLRRLPTLLAFNIGLVSWETVVVIRKGANYGYPLREGTKSMSPDQRDGPVAGRRHHSDADLGHGRTRHGKAHLPGDPVPAQSRDGGDAIANGFVYRGKLVPALKDKLVFGDITTGRIWYAIVPTCSRPTTARRRPSHRFTRSTPACVDSPKRRTARAAGKETRSPAWRAGRSRPRRRAVRRRQRWRALHPDQARRHDQEGRRRQGDDGADVRCDGARRRCWSERHQPASRQPQESRRIDARVDRRREARLRRQLRRLSRQPGARRGQGRHHDLHHRGAARQAAAGSHR